MAPVFTTDVTAIMFALDVAEVDNTGCNYTSYVMISQYVMSLMQLRKWYLCTIYHSIVIPKNICLLNNWYSKIL